MAITNHPLGDIDATHPNKVFCYTKNGDFTVEGIRSYVKTIEGVLHSKTEPYVVVYDNNDVKWLGSQERIAAGKALGALEEGLQDYYVATFAIIKSPILRMISKGILLVVKFKKPILLVDSEEEAHRKADELLAKAISGYVPQY